MTVKFVKKFISFNSSRKDDFGALLTRSSDFNIFAQQTSTKCQPCDILATAVQLSVIQPCMHGDFQCMATSYLHEHVL